MLTNVMPNMRFCANIVESRAGVTGQRRTEVSSQRVGIHGRVKFGGLVRFRVRVEVIHPALLPVHEEEGKEGRKPK